MLNYNEIKERKFIIFEDQPYEVLTSHVFRKQQRKPVNAAKLRNMLTGSVLEHSFHQSDKVHEADVVKRNVIYLFKKDGRGDQPTEYWFCSEKNPKDRFMLPEVLVINQLRFVKPNDKVTALVFTDQEDEEQIIGITPDMKVALTVTEAPPNIKGDSATGGNKVVILETGTPVNAPLFINTGDVIRINTETGEYVERVEKN
ncbi:MAG: hypothetical protein KBC22_02255 [Candidatus Pacebacteria bacterium]|nr:hypothetical protein [Candidatus Paceibacterota bacterium]